MAYGLKSCRPLMADGCPMLSGEPAWLRKGRFGIEAKSPAGSKEYAATELRNGAAPQLQEELRNLARRRFHLKAHFEERQLPVYAFSVAYGGIRMKKTAAGSISKIVFRRVDLPAGIQATQVVAVQSTVHELADLYAKFMDRPVIDPTGLTERFDFTAFGKQAGLKLRAAPGPVSVLVIDSAAHPTAN
jgi:uncharacterized protein (TIGR03435 family)